MKQVNKFARAREMIGRKRLFAALALIAIAMSTIGYATLLTGQITVTTEEVVTVDDVSATFPARSAGSITFVDMITLDFTIGGFAGDDVVLMRVELVIDDPEIYEGFKSLVIQIRDGSTVEAVLTKNTLYDEFEVTVATTPASESYDVKVIFATGKKTLSNVPFKLSATVIGFG